MPAAAGQTDSACADLVVENHGSLSDREPTSDRSQTPHAFRARWIADLTRVFSAKLPRCVLSYLASRLPLVHPFSDDNMFSLITMTQGRWWLLLLMQMAAVATAADADGEAARVSQANSLAPNACVQCR